MSGAIHGRVTLSDFCNSLYCVTVIAISRDTTRQPTFRNCGGCGVLSEELYRSTKCTTTVLSKKVSVFKENICRVLRHASLHHQLYYLLREPISYLHCTRGLIPSWFKSQCSPTLLRLPQCNFLDLISQEPQ